MTLLIALDALLEERSVGAAAYRLGLSEPAMSRALGRLRAALGDPILVRAGQRMVPTPRAEAIGAEVHELAIRVRAVLSPAAAVDLANLEQTFTIATNDAVVTSIGTMLLERTAREASGISLRFLAEPPFDTDLLRTGRADLEISAVPSAGLPAEVRTEDLADDRSVVVVRPGHPLTEGPLTLERFCAAAHITASRRGRLSGPVDDALAARGYRRRVAAAAPTFAACLLMVARSDLVGTFPDWQYRQNIAALGMIKLDMPFPLPPIRLAQSWHPRHDRDPAHAWLRRAVRDAAARCQCE